MVITHDWFDLILYSILLITIKGILRIKSNQSQINQKSLNYGDFWSQSANLGSPAIFLNY
ncbi:hypothetical protein BpHYR1_036294 [Brachionus plicatilis]|uniref:Uncharacterized protein n=1 Tax=Brachionus plicatilis TaxID=10195 RepID=A0A3M7PY27_BRAPC|nr:hypothetical protein BpHYR1_036294 [Brachionus plicatilis]